MSAGVFVEEVARELMLVELFNLNIKKVEKVMIKYVRRANRVREGLNWIIRVIQPRWAIDE